MANGNRIALVTGGARGIGAATARRLGRAGHEVIIVDIAETDGSAAALRAQGLTVHADRCDVSDEAAVTELFAGIAARFGRLDVLVNNAGLAPRRAGTAGDVATTGLADWQRVMAVNLTGPFLMCRAAVPLMASRRFGRIVNVASRAARTYSAGVTASYAASKAGLIGFSRSLAGEVAGSGITVNCVAPARVATAMTQSAPSSAEDDRRAAATIPLGRIAEPEDVAAAIAWLASDDAGFVTGAILDVTGGQFMP